MQAAVFLDRDGVLNELVPQAGVFESPLRVQDVVLIEGAAQAALALMRAGFTLVCVSNQPAAAKGILSVEQVLAIHARVTELLEQQGVRFGASRLCLHHPEGVESGLAGVCACRKPAPGMLLDAAHAIAADLRSSWMVGDTDADVAAGQAAGCRTLLVEHPGSAHKRRGEARPDLRAPSLRAGVAKIIGAARARESETRKPMSQSANLAD